MKLAYKDNRVERVVFWVNLLAAAVVVATFVALFGFAEPLVSAPLLYGAQGLLLLVFVAEKVVRLNNALHKPEFVRAHWYEIPLLAGLAVALAGSAAWFGQAEASAVRHLAVGVYLVLQVVFKVCRRTVDLAATGRNPTMILISSFVVLIVAGAGTLMLPRASRGEPVSFVDALFTATSATCVTGLVVKDTGKDFTFMGHCVILGLMQLGGLGIVIFGAVFALLLGQALSVRESVAMQDLLSAQTVGRIGNMIAFIFFGTMLFEVLGAVGLYGMWDDVQGWSGGVGKQCFYSVFHSVSAFCNAGFALFGDSLVRYSRSWAVYGVVCPLIISGGLGWGVLYNLSNIAADRVSRFFKKLFFKEYRFSMEVPKRLRLQTKIVLWVSGILIVSGTAAILLMERYGGNCGPGRLDPPGAFFQSVTARTAGFNTVDIAAMSDSSKTVLILLMFVGGSPGSTSGGIKTVTLAVLVAAVTAALRKRGEVELFKRSIRVVVVGRAITVTALFVVALFAAALLLSVTERHGGFTMMDLVFESASALGTVGLTTGVTPALTSAGKWIIMAAMLIGRLGPLTLMAALTFNLKPVRYSYPDEAIVVG